MWHLSAQVLRWHELQLEDDLWLFLILKQGKVDSHYAGTQVTSVHTCLIGTYFTFDLKLEYPLEILTCLRSKRVYQNLFFSCRFAQKFQNFIPMLLVSFFFSTLSLQKTQNIVIIFRFRITCWCSFSRYRNWSSTVFNLAA